jgi:hypothetical protein
MKMSVSKLICLNIGITVLTTLATIASFGAGGPPSAKFDHLSCNMLHIMDGNKEYGIHMVCDKVHGPIIELNKAGDSKSTYITVKGFTQETHPVTALAGR